ncbi:MAG TPA: hypothetical protein VLG10_00450 [Methylomirabilota bacterium]|nr:hypothetical protein [Methylomirabilota bacterium]
MEHSLARVTSILCIPYGYTVTLWCAGAWTVTRYGLPGRFDVLLFATGAATAFLILGVVGRPHLDPEVPMRVPAIVVLNALPILAVAIVVGIPPGTVSRGAAFFASSFLATASYIVSVATLIRLVRGRPRTK